MTKFKQPEIWDPTMKAKDLPKRPVSITSAEVEGLGGARKGRYDQLLGRMWAHTIKTTNDQIITKHVMSPAHVRGYAYSLLGNDAVPVIVRKAALEYYQMRLEDD